MTPEERLSLINREIDRRIDLIRRIEAGGPEGIATALAFYQDQPVRWMHDFLWGFDPRNQKILAHKGTDEEQALPVYVPMNPCTAQEEMILWMVGLREQRENGFVPKSRGVGLSYYAVALELFWWLFEPGFSGSVLANGEELVDQRADPDTLFEKARIMLEFLPAWMRPRGFELGRTSEHDNHRRLINPENGATITGKIGKNPGRGGRSSFCFVDEAAHIDDLVSVRRAIRDNSDCTVEGSTYNGTGEPFYQATEKGGPFVFKITWEDIPFYDQAWFERKRAQYADDPAGFAQEILADPTASVPDLVIPASWVRACIQFEGWYRETYGRSPNMTGGRYAGLDVAGYGSNKTVLILRDGAVIQDVLVNEEGNTTINAYWAHEEGARFNVERMAYDDVGIGQGVGDTWAATSKGRPQFAILPFNGGAQPTEYQWPTGMSSRERFENLRSEMWWHVRERCRKTYEMREGIRGWPPSECLSLPRVPELIQQLSLPKEIRDRRRIMVESKKEMKARGIESPDFADALVMSEFCNFATTTGRQMNALERMRAIHGAR